jgi:hypothetical protein
MAERGSQLLIAYEFGIKPILVRVCGGRYLAMNYNNSLSLWNFDEYFLKSRVRTSARGAGDGRGAAYRKSGWKTFDPNATPYDANQVKKERSLYM